MTMIIVEHQNKTVRGSHKIVVSIEVTHLQTFFYSALNVFGIRYFG